MAVIYQQLCPVLYGTDALAEMCKRAAAEGKKKAFICCDKGIRAVGAADRVAQALKAEGVDSFIYDEVIPDAPDTFVNPLADKMKEYGTDLIIGLGGGSSLDAAKAAGVAMDNGKPINVFMEENGNPGFIVKVPVYVVPTSAGTGSEVTPQCVIHEMSSDSKKVVLRHAELAVLDPTLTVSCPPSVTLNAGMDALAHAVEASTAVNPNPKDLLLAIQAVKLIYENLPKAIANGEDLEARGNMQLAANFAGIAFAGTSVHVGHCYAHEVGLRFELNHGICCGLSIPETIRYVCEAKPKEIRMIAEALHVDIPANVSAKEAGDILAAGVRKWTRSLGQKTLPELGVDRAELIKIAKDAIDHNWFHVMCPGDVSYEQMAQYLADSYDNFQ